MEAPVLQPIYLAGFAGRGQGENATDEKAVARIDALAREFHPTA